MSQYSAIVAMRKYRSQGVGVVLTGIFGGLGLLYSSILGGITVFGVEFVIGYMLGQHIVEVTNSRLMFQSFGYNFPFLYEINKFLYAIFGVRILALIISYVSISTLNRKIDEQILALERGPLQERDNELQRQLEQADRYIAQTKDKSMWPIFLSFGIFLTLILGVGWYIQSEKANKKYILDDVLRENEFISDNEYVAEDTANVFDTPDPNLKTSNSYYPPGTLFQALKENNQFIYFSYTDTIAKKPAYGWIRKEELYDLSKEKCEL